MKSGNSGTFTRKHIIGLALLKQHQKLSERDVLVPKVM